MRVLLRLFGRSFCGRWATALAAVVLITACGVEDLAKQLDGLGGLGGDGGRVFVRGKITGADGPVAGAAVELEGDGAPLAATTGTDGSYEFADVAAGAYHLVARAQEALAVGAASDAVEFRAEHDVQVTSVSLDVEPLELTGAIAGNALLLGAPDGADGTTDHTGIEVFVPGTSFAARTDRNGAFLMLYVQPGTYEIRLEREGYEAVDLPAVEVRSAELTAIDDAALQRKADCDGDGIFDDVDPDDDDDGHNDAGDMFPCNDLDWADADGDGVGDNADTQLTGGPDQGSNSSPNVTFRFTAAIDGLTGFECRLDDGAWAACSSPHALVVPEGNRAFAVRYVAGTAVDSAPAAVEWFVLDPPNIVLDAAPEAATTATSATFVFHTDADDLDRFECRLQLSDGTVIHGYTACTSPYIVDGLAAGDYAFGAYAVDDYGHVTPGDGEEAGSIWYEWTVIPTWAAVAAGGADTCAIRSDATLWCWGANDSRQTGTGLSNDSIYRPERVGSYADWVTVSVGGTHACGIRAAGTLWCWGRNSDGEVGNGGTSTAVTMPTQVGSQSDWTAIDAGAQMTCGIRGAAGTLWCWGEANNERLGFASATSVLSPTQVTAEGDGWAAVMAGMVDPPGSGQTCALKTAGTLWCWARGGMQGNGFVSDTTYQDWQHVDLGERGHLCGRRTNDELHCWSYQTNNQYGELGQGDGSAPADPPALVAIAASGQPALGWQHSCSLDDEGALYCWGDNVYGQLGNADFSLGDPTGPDDCGGLGCSLAPQQVLHAPDHDSTPPIPVRWQQVAAGTTHTCALASDGTLWCWGSTGSGQLGDAGGGGGCPNSQGCSIIPGMIGD